MSEQLNKLVVNIPQNFSVSEKQQGRENLGISGEGWLVPDRPNPANDLMLTTDTLGAMQWAPQSELQGIKPSQLSSYILAGSNITITPSSSSITISSTGGGQTYSAGAGISIVNNEIAAKTDNSTILVNVDGELEANIPAQQQSNWTESDNTSPSFILNKPDLSVYMQPSQLSSYIVAGSNMSITTSGSTLTLNATAAPQVQSDWAETDPADASYILNKPAIPVVPTMKPLVAGSNVSIVDGTNDVTISASASPQLQANWNETSTSSVQYIQNKPTIPTLPTMKPLVAGSNVTITEGVSDVTIAATASAQQQANWNESDSSSVQYIQNKPTIPAALSAGSGIGISNDAISRRVQFVTTSSTYTAVRNIIDGGDLPVLDVANGSMHNLFVCTMYRGSDIQFIGSAYGETTLYNLASNSTWTSQILEPQILQANAGRILAINAAGTDAEWRSWVAVPSYAFADRGKLLKVVYENDTLGLKWDQPNGYVPWETDWASGYTHSYTVTADDVTAGYFDMYQAFAAGADTTSTIVDPIRVNLTWDTWCTSGLASNYVSSIDFAIGVDGGSFRDMFTDNSPAHEVHKDWYLYPNYLLHTRCNRIRIRYNLTASAVAGTQFQNEVSGLVDQVR